MWVYRNQLTILPKLPNGLKTYYYSCNPVHNYINNNCAGDLDIYNKENTIFANKLGVWFLECKYNPKYKYCRNWINSKYDSLML